MNGKLYLDKKVPKDPGLLLGKETLQIGSIYISERFLRDDDNSPHILPELGLFNPFFDSEVKDLDHQ